VSVVLNAEKRIGSGRKSEVRDMRKAGRVPGILYGGDTQPSVFSLAILDVSREMRKPGFFNHVFEILLEGKTERALVRDVQFHPVTDRPIHIDLLRVGAGTQVTVSVPVRCVGDDKCPGLKRGGMLNLVVHALEMSVPADAIPEVITISIEGLQIGDSIHLSQIQLPEGVKVLHASRDQTLATFAAPSGAADDEGNSAAS
jgi:large subunit ribosomal protein L25